QNAALTGGPGAGSTIYVNRSPASTVNNASHSPANLTSATDIRLFSGANGAWTTNSTNGADCMLMAVYIGAAMTDADRNALEAQIYNKFTAILLANSSVAAPKLGANGEAFNFTTWASETVAGVNGKSNLLFNDPVPGTSWVVGSSPNGIAGLRETTNGSTTNFPDFVGSNNFPWDKRTFTVYSVFTMSTAQMTASFLPGIFSVCQGTLGTSAGRLVSWSLNKDHGEMNANTADVSGANTDYSNLMIGVPNSATAGSPAYYGFSSFFGTGALPLVSVPAHDNIVAPSSHPPFYTDKKFLGYHQTTDGYTFPGSTNTANDLGNVTLMMVLKHTPHPNYDFSKSDNDPANIPWRNKATVEVKIAFVGAVDGFNKFLGSHSTYYQAASTAVANSVSGFGQVGDQIGGLGTFDGWQHASVFLGNQYTSDAQDQAMFWLLGSDPSKVSSLL
ncbi:hypothetical protein, partial [Rhizobium lusitanum]|uniref:hypothetical protein n=1 Tax=Rhizobium lusitanum TaxID=293958 RepID=UPI00195AB263